MGAQALPTVRRFENLVTGLNLLEQFEFHVKAPLTAHICSASRSVPLPRLCRKTSGDTGAVAGVWEPRMPRKARRGGVGGVGGEGRGKGSSKERRS